MKAVHFGCRHECVYVLGTAVYSVVSSVCGACQMLSACSDSNAPLQQAVVTWVQLLCAAGAASAQPEPGVRCGGAGQGAVGAAQPGLQGRGAGGSTG